MAVVSVLVKNYNRGGIYPSCRLQGAEDSDERRAVGADGGNKGRRRRK
jgi:hypothetical protein